MLGHVLLDDRVRVEIKTVYLSGGLLHISASQGFTGEHRFPAVMSARFFGADGVEALGMRQQRVRMTESGEPLTVKDGSLWMDFPIEVTIEGRVGR